MVDVDFPVRGLSLVAHPPQRASCDCRIYRLPLPLSDWFFVFVFATSNYEKFISYAIAIALYFNVIGIFLYVVEIWQRHANGIQK